MAIESKIVILSLYNKGTRNIFFFKESRSLVLRSTMVYRVIYNGTLESWSLAILSLLTNISYHCWYQPTYLNSWLVSSPVNQLQQPQASMEKKKENHSNT